jgi:acylphosphatase
MTARFVVSGMVQGVGFRWYVARHARAIGLTGYARNLPDGSVEVVVDGPESSLPELERLLRTGPANARVERVERTQEPALAGTNKSFDVL